MFVGLSEEELLLYCWFHIKAFLNVFVLAIKKPLISAPRSDNHQSVLHPPTEQPHAPNLAPGKMLTGR